MMYSIALPQTSTPPVALFAALHELLSDAVQILDRDRDGTRDMLSRAVALLDGQTRTPPAQIQAGLAPWQAKKAERHIDDNLEETLSVEELAKELGLCRSTFSRLFKKTFRQPPQRYITERRVERAKEIMTSTDEPLCQIAVICGFCDQSHFSRAFRQVTGMSPYLWRRGHGANEHGRDSEMYA